MMMSNEKQIRKRNRAEVRFRTYGVLSLLAAGSVLLFLIYTIVSSGYSAFFRATVQLDVQLDAGHMDVAPPYTQNVLLQGRYTSVVKQALYAQFPGVTDRKHRRDLVKMLSPGAELSVRDYLIDYPDRIGSTVSLEVPLSSDFDQLYKEHLPRSGEHIRFTATQLQWYDRLRQEGRIHYRFNTQFCSVVIPVIRNWPVSAVQWWVLYMPCWCVFCWHFRWVSLPRPIWRSLPGITT